MSGEYGFNGRHHGWVFDLADLRAPEHRLRNPIEEKMSVIRKPLAILSGLAACMAAAPALAAQPTPWQTRFQPAATSIMEQTTWFEIYSLWFILPITVLVMLLLGWVMVRYRASANPNPSRTSHNTLIEVIWTIGPVVVLLFLAVPSFQLLSAQYSPPEDPAITIKATGVQWYWDYEYQTGEEPLSFSSLMLAEKEGIYYGQCSELCGKDHAFMPIAIRVVSADQYDTWLAAARSDLAGANKALMAATDAQTKVAAAGE
jgi:cytochrome c oxidase subunit 2